ncbi:branched-chain amino acid ABC transporter permease [Rhizobium sp. KVB221]|uniref:Branched-chain amino acid ABC transporter permease n=2 Tax=Rhizobium setariae TaxID=2801340 RepID=A0A936YT60_9HYPH|nr:branched-chain amino acid ABC transporter permease [Rhizobium setariae]
MAKLTARARLSIAIAALLTLLLLAGPLFLGRAELRLMMEVLSYLALAQMWNLLAGYAGLVSVGQQAFVGVGGYLFFALTMLAGVPVLLALPAAGLVAMVLALPIGWLALRLRGAYFAIGTWVIAEVLRILAGQVPGLGGGSGISIPTDIVKSVATDRDVREMIFYWIALGLAVASILVVWRLLRSRWGLALTAVRDSEIASESLGVKIWQTRFIVFVLVAGFTAVVGAFIFLQKLRISPDAAFSINDWTAFVIFIVVIGGVGTIEGPIIGVIAFFVLRELLADLGTWNFIIMGLVAIAVMLIDKRGIWGALAARGVPPLFRTKRTFIG